MYKTTNTPPLTNLLDEYAAFTLKELPFELSLLRNIQHQIEFLPCAKLLNIPYYRLSPKDHNTLQSMVECLL